MFRPRVIPCLLLSDLGLVKTVMFKSPKYLGDPINIVKIFNDKEVDELVFLDILATIEQRQPPYKLLKEVAEEAFMPLAYGGGIRSLEIVRTVLELGFEKIILNTFAAENPQFVRQSADFAGSQSVVVSMDTKKSLLGKYEVYVRGGRKATGFDAVRFAVEMEKQGAGEILVNSIDRDGTMTGYDLELVKRISSSVNIPVVACGGAKNALDLGRVVKDGGASAAAAGSMFVFQGPHRAVLISYPKEDELRDIFGAESP